VALSVCETTCVLPLMSRRELRHPHAMGQIIELRHPHAMGQIMLLSLVTSHELSLVSVPLVDRLALFWGGFSLGSNIRSSRLVWDRRIDCFDRSCRLPSSLPPSLLLCSWVWEGSFLPTRVGGGSSPPPRVSGGSSFPLRGMLLVPPMSGWSLIASPFGVGTPLPPGEMLDPPPLAG